MRGFNIKEISVNDYSKVIFINIENISLEFSNFIEEKFINICEGDSESNIDNVKKRLLNFLESKDITTKMGAIAEFFIHLYLNSNDFKQECLFFNLEENSIKKGFDGYYSKNNEEWIMESKSGSIDTKKISHSNKIKEAYKDLQEKLAGKVNNNPWQNAYNHASHIDVGTHKDIRKNIKKLSDDFVNNNFYEISDFNIIPGSTIFLKGDWIDLYSDEVIEEINNTIKKLKYKKITVICITKRSVELFISFLRGSEIEKC